METEMTLQLFYKYLRIFLLILTDYCSVYGTLVLSLFIYYLLGAKYEMVVSIELVFFPCIFIVINSFSRLYGGSILYPGLGVNKIEELKRITINLIASYFLLFSYFGMVRNAERYSRVAIALSLLLSVVIVPIFRHAIRYLLRNLKWDKIPVLVVGAGKTGKLVQQTILEDYYYGLEFKGFIDDRGGEEENVLGKLEELQSIADRMGVSYVVLCLPFHALAKWIHQWMGHFQHILLIPDNAVYPILWVYPMTLGHYSGLEISNRMRMKGYRLCKLMLEFLLAAGIIPFIFLPGLLIALLIKITSPGPVFYRARRLGQNGKVIRILKFRTMYVGADKNLSTLLEENPELRKEWESKFKLKDDPRITPLGKFLRKTSLDELPQFWNVVRGEMAVIGPRPIVPAEVKYYGRNYKIFSGVKPGITGLWQVSGRSNTTYKSRVNLDLYYVNNWSVWMDYFIFLKTIKEVLLRNGAE